MEIYTHAGRFVSMRQNLANKRRSGRVGKFARTSSGSGAKALLWLPMSLPEPMASAQTMAVDAPSLDASTTCLRKKWLQRRDFSANAKDDGKETPPEGIRNEETRHHESTRFRAWPTNRRRRQGHHWHHCDSRLFAAAVLGGLTRKSGTPMREAPEPPIHAS